MKNLFPDPPNERVFRSRLFRAGKFFLEVLAMYAYMKALPTIGTWWAIAMYFASRWCIDYLADALAEAEVARARMRGEHFSMKHLEPGQAEPS